jgi:hypothetical protein
MDESSRTVTECAEEEATPIEESSESHTIEDRILNGEFYLPTGLYLPGIEEPGDAIPDTPEDRAARALASDAPALFRILDGAIKSRRADRGADQSDGRAAEQAATGSDSTS